MAKAQDDPGAMFGRPLVLAGAGVALVLSALTIHGLWIFVFYRHELQASRVSEFLSFFPTALQQPGRITTLSAILSFAAMACAVGSRRKATQPVRVTSFATITLAILILLLDIWQSL